MSVATRKERKTTSSTKLRPVGDRLVVMVDDKETVSKGGIVLPDAAQERPSRGVVLAAGGGAITDTGRREMEIKEKDRILFARFAGTEVELGDGADGKPFVVRILRQDDVLAVLEKST